MSGREVLEEDVRQFLPARDDPGAHASKPRGIGKLAELDYIETSRTHTHMHTLYPGSVLLEYSRLLKGVEP